LQFVEIGDAGVEPLDARLHRLRSLYGRQREAMKIDGTIPGSRFQEFNELPFCRLQRRVRHIVDQPDGEHRVCISTIAGFIGFAKLPRGQRRTGNPPMFVKDEGHADSPGLFRRFQPGVVGAGMRQRLVDIFDDVGAVLDTDRKPDRLGQNAGLTLLFGRHLPMRGRCGVTSE
jgi:hypothetical protein